MLKGIRYLLKLCGRADISDAGLYLICRHWRTAMLARRRGVEVSIGLVILLLLKVFHLLSMCSTLYLLLIFYISVALALLRHNDKYVAGRCLKDCRMQVSLIYFTVTLSW